jgi:hypothetical protein
MGVNSSHVITCTQYLIQPAATRTIHRSQGLTLNYLAFDLNGVHHHGLTYTSSFCVRKKKINKNYSHN